MTTRPELDLQALQTRSVAYEARTHFLNPRGDTTWTATPVTEPFIEFAVAEMPEPPAQDQEVAWIDYQRDVYDAPEVVQSRQFLTSERAGSLHLATMWKDGEYTFASLEELMESPELPIYTMEWLVRFINLDRKAKPAERRDRDQLHRLFQQNRPIGKVIQEARDQYAAREAFRAMGGDMPEPKTGSLEPASSYQNRLAWQAISEFPHLEEWYASRGVITE